MNGENEVTITVTNTDGTSTVEKVYTVVVTKPVPTTLSDLEITETGSATPAELTPEFSAATTSYAVNVESATGTVTVTATSQDATVGYAITGEVSCEIDQQGVYNLGDNETATIVVTVSGAGSQSTVYSIAVTRIDTSLASVTGSSSGNPDVSATWDSGELEWKLDWQNGATSGTLAAVPTDDSATVTWATTADSHGSITAQGAFADLQGSGNHKFKATVTNGTATEDWTVNIYIS